MKPRRSVRKKQKRKREENSGRLEEMNTESRERKRNKYLKVGGRYLRMKERKKGRNQWRETAIAK
jgi:hypothetical protein